MEIDDSIEASLVYGISCLWGVLAVGIFDVKHGLINAGNSAQLVIQIKGATAMVTWSAAIAYGVYTVIERQGRLRVKPIFEVAGFSDFDIQPFVIKKSQPDVE